MPLCLRWTTDPADDDRIATARLQSYAGAMKDIDAFRKTVLDDPRRGPGDCLLAEEAGTPVGTSTSLSLRMVVRGATLPCQGVAWVGAVKTHRRRRGTADDDNGGIASQVMRATLERARERGEVLSALMPFRASFYERFGYGIVERRAEWTLPMAVLPVGEHETIRFYEPTGRDALLACRQRVAEQGQADVLRSDAQWAWTLTQWQDGLIVVDRDGAGTVRGWAAFQHVPVRRHAMFGEHRTIVKVAEIGYETAGCLRRLLQFFGSLRDQYAGVELTLPGSLPLSLLLRESQVPHRPVNHPVAAVRPFTRMQVRVLDSGRLLAAMRWPDDAAGSAVVSIREPEGGETRLRVEVSAGRATATPAEASADVTLPAKIWAAVALGDLPLSTAWQLELAEVHRPAVVPLLNALAAGPRPFTLEYF